MTLYSFFTEFLPVLAYFVGGVVFIYLSLAGYVKDAGLPYFLVGLLLILEALKLLWF